MEKFTNWRDRGTGIAPFLPPSVGVSSLLSKFVLSTTLVFKCTLMLPLIIVWSVTRSKIVYKWILFILCAWNMDIVVQGVKKRDTKEGIHFPQKNKLYICNCSSPLDALALYLIAQGPSCFLLPSGNVTFKMSKEQYMDFVLDGSLNVKKFGQEVKSIDQLKGSVVYMFPEGTSSNGKSVLPFEIDSSSLQEFLGSPSIASPNGPLVQTIHLKVNATLVTPLAISRFKYLARMITKGVNIKIKINEPQSISPIDNLRIALNDGNKYKLVSKTLDMESKRKFVQEFSRT